MDVSFRRGVTRRGFLTVAVSAIVAGVVAGVGAYYAGTLSAPVKEVVKEVTKTVTSTTTLAPGAPYTTTVTVTAPPTTLTKTETITVTATPTPAKPTLPPKDKFVVGYACSLTGAYAADDLPKQKTVYDIIVEEWNAKGGIYLPEYGKRVPIEVKIEDAKSDIETYIRLLEKFITVDKVDWLFSVYGTAAHFAIVPLLEKYKYPVITLTCMSDRVPEMIYRGESHYLFPIMRSSTATARCVVDFITHVVKETGLKNIGVIYITELFGLEGAGALRVALAEKGLKPVVYEGYPIGVTDLSPLIKKLLDANVEILVVYTYPSDTFLLMKQAKELNLSPKIWIGNMIIDTPLVAIPNFGKDTLMGLIIMWGFCAYDKPYAREFAEKYKAKTGYYPTPHQIALYLAQNIAFSLIEKYGLDREKIAKALWTETFDTPLGKARFDPMLGFVWEGRGDLGQWQGGDKLEVIWPPEAATAKWILKPPWPS
jgi:branched-chain amino acid transport system substrate-binding protein